MAKGVEVYHKWTVVEQLKDFLCLRRIPLTGNKAELVTKVYVIVQMDTLEEDLEAVRSSVLTFQLLKV